MPAFVWEKMKSRMRDHTTKPDVGCCRIGITQCHNISYLLAIWIYRCLHAFVSRRATRGAGVSLNSQLLEQNPLCADFYLVQVRCTSRVVYLLVRCTGVLSAVELPLHTYCDIPVPVHTGTAQEQRRLELVRARLVQQSRIDLLLVASNSQLCNLYKYVRCTIIYDVHRLELV